MSFAFGLQHLHSTFSKCHSTSFQMQSLRILHCVGAQRASSTFYTVLRYGCSILGTSCAKSLMLGIVHTPSSGQPQRVERPISFCAGPGARGARAPGAASAASASQHPQVTYSKATRTLQVLTFVPINISPILCN